MKICEWTNMDEIITASSDGEKIEWKNCQNEATHTTCQFIGFVCIEHKCRCSKLLRLPFQTTPEQIEKLNNIIKPNLYFQDKIIGDTFEKLIELGKIDQGVFDLLELWHENRQEEKNLVKDAFAALKDYKIKIT